MTFNIYFCIDDWCEREDVFPYLYLEDKARLISFCPEEEQLIFGRIDISLRLPITKKYNIQSIKLYSYHINSDGVIFKIRKMKNLHKFLCEYCFNGFEILE